MIPPRVGVHLAHREVGADQRALQHHAVAHALGAVAQDRVRDLVTHHRREALLVLGDRQQAGVDRALAARQRPGVDHLGIVDQRELPQEILRSGVRVELLGGLRDALADALHHLILRTRRNQLLLGEHLLVGVGAEPHLLRGRK
jgi:hypothetical protein